MGDMVITTAVITGLVMLPVAKVDHFCITGGVMGSPFVVWAFTDAHMTCLACPYNHEIEIGPYC